MKRLKQISLADIPRVGLGMPAGSEAPCPKSAPMNGLICTPSPCAGEGGDITGGIK